MIYKNRCKRQIPWYRLAEMYRTSYVIKGISQSRKMRGFSKMSAASVFACRRVVENKNPAVGCGDICTMEIRPKVLWNPLVNTIPAFGGLAECSVQGDNTDCRIFICTNFYIQKKHWSVSCSEPECRIFISVNLHKKRCAG